MEVTGAEARVATGSGAAAGKGTDAALAASVAAFSGAGDAAGLGATIVACWSAVCGAAAGWGAVGFTAADTVAGGVGAVVVVAARPIGLMSRGGARRAISRSIACLSIRSAAERVRTNPAEYTASTAAELITTRLFATF